jgi:CDP-glucose 4,6-dehydratase
VEHRPAVANLGLTSEFWRGRRVLVTGHTGFKGAWLSLWLSQLGADVTGVSTHPPALGGLFDLAGLRDRVTSIQADICHYDAIEAVLRRRPPQVVFHLAAQPIVRTSLAIPRRTYETNVMGTVNVLEAVRAVGGVRVVLNVSSETGYVGGHDPYSTSKRCSEIVTDAYRRSFFEEGDDDAPRVASARTGNLIGGGDRAADRLIPDIMRAAAAGEPVRIRNPNAVRPWQHVLNPIDGYLTLVEAIDGDASFADAWSFGPPEDDLQTVGWIVARLDELWPGGVDWEADSAPTPHEAPALQATSARPGTELGWAPRWRLADGLVRLVEWHLAQHDGADLSEVTLAQLEAYATA